MKKISLLLMIVSGFPVFASGISHEKSKGNPLIYADVPDMSMVRVGNAYYMSSTTMHMSPGVPVMKSEDLTNWEMVSYAYDTLSDTGKLNLENNQNAYGKGSWASCIRYHKGTYYVSTFSSTTGMTYIYSTTDIEKGEWKKMMFKPSCHDHTIFFDDDGKVYIIWGNGKLMMSELKNDLSGLKEGTERVLIDNASAPAGKDIMLGAEGSQLFNVDGKYYLFNIVWPRNGMRTVVVHRSDRISGPYEGKVVFQDRGIAQGGLIDTPDGRWFAYLFRDSGAVGRIPYLVPVEWKNGWPVLGVDGKAPDTLDLPDGKGLTPGIVASDEFDREKDASALPMVWQWNHNPDNAWWKVENGYLRLTTGRLDRDLESARNTLTQRTIGPVCSGTTKMDVAGMKDGDFAGLCLLQKHYGQVGIKCVDNQKFIYVINASSDKPVEQAEIPFNNHTVYFRAECDFRENTDLACFYYSVDGKEWCLIGEPLKMTYTLDHFMGYRFGLYNYATKMTGGYVDFDYFRISKEVSVGRTEKTGSIALFNYVEYTGADDTFISIDENNQYQNPIISGFYPDPSICRKDSDYYLVTSSFSYYPGIPVFHSTDLVNWVQTGNVLNRPAQLQLKPGIRLSGGIYAPTIRYNAHNDTFYLITTCVDGIGNFIVKTKNPKENNWSDPIPLRFGGIDPDIFFDEDGKGYIVHNDEPPGDPEWDGHRAIWLRQFCVDGDSIIGEKQLIVDGGTDKAKHPVWIEAPHLYKINSYYYLLCAEGGTSVQHSEVVFRADNVLGPYLPWKDNPVLTQRDLPEDRNNPVTSAGHADLVQTGNGDWYAVFLACRPYEGNYYNTGRETFMLPVTWIEGYPVILPKNKEIPYVVNKSALHPNNESDKGNFTWRDNFDGERLNARYLMLRTPPENEWWNIAKRSLMLRSTEHTIYEPKQPAFVGIRQQHLTFSAQTEVLYSPESKGDIAGLVCYQREKHNFVFGKTVDENGKMSLVLIRAEGDIKIVARTEIPVEHTKKALALKVQGAKDKYSFFYSYDNGVTWEAMAENVDAKNLSTQVAGGFSGTVIGCYVYSNPLAEE